MIEELDAVRASLGEPGAAERVATMAIALAQWRRRGRACRVVSDARARWIVRAGVTVIRLLARTWRMRAVNDEGLRAARASGTARSSSRSGTASCFRSSGTIASEGVAVLISEHRDGEIIARIAERLGYTHGARLVVARRRRARCIGLMRALEGGRDVAVTPDGPRGPAHVFAPGAADRRAAHWRADRCRSAPARAARGG